MPGEGEQMTEEQRLGPKEGASLLEGSLMGLE
jgi:hypothetical protein